MRIVQKTVIDDTTWEFDDTCNDLLKEGWKCVKRECIAWVPSDDDNERIYYVAFFVKRIWWSRNKDD